MFPFIPIFAGLSALCSLTRGAAGVVKAVNGSRAAKEQLAESVRHNNPIESIALGKGLYLQKYEKGMGLYQCQKTFKKVPKHAHNHAEIVKYAKLLKISNFRGVFMRDHLPPCIFHNECGIINLDDFNIGLVIKKF